MKLLRQETPAGLLDKNIEFFTDPKFEIPFYISEGVVCSCVRLDDDIYQIMLADAKNNRKWWQILGVWHGSDERKKVYRHIACRYGALNSTPDLAPDGTILPDVRFCAKCAECEGFGIGCATLDVLSKREMLAAILIAQGLGDKQIADAMKISLHTLNEYKKRISVKLDAHSKIDIVAKLFNAII